MRIPTLLLLLLGTLFLLPGAQGQTRTLTLETNAPEAQVFIDSAYVGLAREAPFEIAAAAARMVLRPPVGSWNVQPRAADIPSGPAPRVRLDLPYAYRIESQPFGARVDLITPSGTRTRLGVTPLDLLREAPLDGVLEVGREAYGAARVTPGDGIWNRYTVVLTPLDAPVREGYEEVFAPRRVWLDAALVGVSLAATAVAVRYKFEANDLFEQYRETGDPALRPRIKRLDLKSGTALTVAGLGLGVFSFRLALRR